MTSLRMLITLLFIWPVQLRIVPWNNTDMSTQPTRKRGKGVSPHYPHSSQLGEIFKTGEDVKAFREVKKFLKTLAGDLDVNIKFSDQLEVVKNIQIKIEESYPHIDDASFQRIKIVMAKSHAARRNKLKHKKVSPLTISGPSTPTHDPPVAFPTIPTHDPPVPFPTIPTRDPPVPFPTNVSQVEEVESFLQACIPPMGHLLQRLLSYGCRNQQFLYAVSQWPKAEIEEFLHNLPTLGGRDITPMEVQVLRVHFLQYFAGRSG